MKIKYLTVEGKLISFWTCLFTELRKPAHCPSLSGVQFPCESGNFCLQLSSPQNFVILFIVVEVQYDCMKNHFLPLVKAMLLRSVIESILSIC